MLGWVKASEILFTTIVRLNVSTPLLRGEGHETPSAGTGGSREGSACTKTGADIYIFDLTKRKPNKVNP